MPSLNTFQPEQSAHGTEINLLAKGPAGDYVQLAEIFEMQWDEDQNLEKMPVLGGRVTGTRRGRFSGSGIIKAYWLNGDVFSMWMGATVPNQSGSASAIYHSQIPFTRYNIRVTSTNANAPAPRTLINCTFGKETATWNADKFTEESISFEFEDVLEA